MLQKTKQDERLSFLIDCFRSFKEFMQSNDGIEITFSEGLDISCSEVNSYYWSFISLIKEEKYLISKNGDDNPTNANIYKIISATEYSIIRLQPIQGEKSRELNAQLAFFVSVSLYNFWFTSDFSNNDFLKNHHIKEIWTKFTEDRLTWLMNFDETNSFPFFLNSQVWMLIDIITRKETI